MALGAPVAERIESFQTKMAQNRKTLDMAYQVLLTASKTIESAGLRVSQDGVQANRL